MDAGDDPGVAYISRATAGFVVTNCSALRRKIWSPEAPAVLARISLKGLSPVLAWLGMNHTDQSQQRVDVDIPPAAEFIAGARPDPAEETI